MNVIGITGCELCGGVRVDHDDGTSIETHGSVCETIRALVNRVADLEAQLNAIPEGSRLPPVPEAKRQCQCVGDLRLVRTGHVMRCGSCKKPVRVRCPECARFVTVQPEGVLWLHGPRGSECKGSLKFVSRSGKLVSRHEVLAGGHSILGD